MGPIILLYHSIVENKPVVPYAVSRRVFYDQILWLIDRGYQFISLATLVRSLRTGVAAISRKQVALTFDDGYQDFLIHAFPLLVRHRLPATVFLVTDMLGQTSTFSSYSKEAPLMSEKEVWYVKSHGISLGSHTLTHPDLTTLSDEELQRQLVNSRITLTDFGETFYSFAYPFGYYKKREVEAVKAAGYKCALTVNANFPGPDLCQLGRFSVDCDMDIDSFRHMISDPSLSNDGLVGRAWTVARAVKRRLFSGK